MTLALSEGGLVHKHAEMERAFQRQPEGPTKFQSPRHQQSTSPRPKPANDTVRVHQNDPPPQREQRLFGPKSEVEKIVARKRRDQITAVLRDTNAGPCRTDDAILYVSEVVPHIAIACGQDGFWFALWEWVEINTPHVSRAAVIETVNDILYDPPRYNSVAVGRRMGLTIERYDRLGITLIRPAGWTRKMLDEHLSARRNKTVKERRHAAGQSKTRRELSVEQLAPWDRPDVPCNSRAGWFRLSAEVRAPILERVRAEVAASL